MTETTEDRPTARRPAIASPLPALFAFSLLGIGFLLSTFPPGFFTGTGAYWDSVVSDRGAALIGYLYFVASDWQWPLLHSDILSQPEGTSVALTDSIPVLALIFKALAPLLSEPFNYLGAWTGACYLLNGIAFILLLHRLQVQGFCLQLLGGLLAMLTPVLLHRWYHASLGAHFILLFGFFSYAGLLTHRRPSRALIAQLLLLVLALLIHVYLAAMQAGLLLATATQAWRLGQLKAPSALGWIAGAFVILIGEAWAIGLLGAGSPSGGASGYGFFSANLASPFVSLHSGFTQSGWQLLQEVEQSGNAWAFFRRGWPDATGGQYYEGAIYLGGGVLLLLAVSLACCFRSLAGALRRHALLALIVGLSALFAVGDRLYFGPYEIAALPFAEYFRPLAEVFRANGRFFWLATYAVMIATVVTIARTFRPAKSIPLLALALAVQCVDLLPLRGALSVASANPEFTGLDREQWQQRLERAEKLWIFPSIMCGSGETINAKTELGLMAARAGAVPTNSARTGRSAKDCEEERLDTMRQDLDSGTLHVFFAAGDDGLGRVIGRYQRAENLHCERFRYGRWCTGREPGGISR